MKEKQQERRKPSLEEHRLWLLGFLSDLPRTEQEVYGCLAARGVLPEEGEALIFEFRELGLLDDALYARLFVEGHECWGSERIAYELSRRGVSREHIALALEDRDEEDKARALFEGWLAQGIEGRRIVGRLRRRGFSGRTIASLLKDEDEVPW